MSYLHQFDTGEAAALPLGKIVCVGRNYAAHAEELNNPIPQEPVLFIKPASSVVPVEAALRLPRGKGSCHHEVELAVLIGREARNISPPDAIAIVTGYGVALDLTLRDVQNTLKEKGLPWEKSKAFDGSCVLSPFLPVEKVPDPQALRIRLLRNGSVKQDGNTAQMLTPVAELLAYISSWFSLQPGDVVLTGTPAGVGPLQSGDDLVLELVDLCRYQTQVE